MKRAFLMVFLIALAVPLLAAAISPADLDLPVPGVLPSNPFYFFKEWRRGIGRALTFSRIKSARLELNILNERAAEISKLIKVLPKSQILKIATADYLAELKRFRPIKELTGKIILQHLKHLQLLMEVDNENSFLAQQELKKDLKELLAKNLSAADFRYLLNKGFWEDRADKRPFRGLMAAAAVEWLDDMRLEKAEEDLLIDFVGEWIARDYPDISKFRLTGQPADYLKMLDALRLRIRDRKLKSRLNVLRQYFLDNVKEKELAQRIDDILVKIKHPAGQASFYVRQAKRFYKQKWLRAALGQATLAAAVMPRLINYEEEIKLLKKNYDKLPANQKDEELEEEIVKLADRLNVLSGKNLTAQRFEEEIIALKLKIAILRHL